MVVSAPARVAWASGGTFAPSLSPGRRSARAYSPDGGGTVTFLGTVTGSESELSDAFALVNAATAVVATGTPVSVQSSACPPV